MEKKKKKKKKKLNKIKKKKNVHKLSQIIWLLSVFIRDKILSSCDCNSKTTDLSLIYFKMKYGTNIGMLYKYEMLIVWDLDKTISLREA